MKTVFFGSGPFGLAALVELAGGSHPVAGVVTSSDKRSGRGLKVGESPVKAFARERGLAVLDIADANSDAALAALEKLGADVFSVVSFGTIFSPRLLRLPPRGCVNVHASLLPKYRGASPIAYALLNGEHETGVTTIRLTERLDAGEILLQEALPLKGDENALEVRDRLAALGGKLLVRTLDMMEKGTLKPRKQDDAAATPAPKLKKEDGWMDWTRPAEEIHNRVRAFYIWPGSKTRLDGSEITVLKTSFADKPAAGKPGEVTGVKGPGIEVAAGKGVLFIHELKPEGKKAMGWKDFLNGRPVKPGAVLGGRA